MQDKQELRNIVADKARRVIQNVENVEFEDCEMEMFKEEFGAVYTAYKKAVDVINTKQRGGIDNER